MHKKIQLVFIHVFICCLFSFSVYEIRRAHFDKFDTEHVSCSIFAVGIFWIAQWRLPIRLRLRYASAFAAIEPTAATSSASLFSLSRRRLFVPHLRNFFISSLRSLRVQPIFSSVCIALTNLCHSFPFNLFPFLLTFTFFLSAQFELVSGGDRRRLSLFSSRLRFPLTRSLSPPVLHSFVKYKNI